MDHRAKVDFVNLLQYTASKKRRHQISPVCSEIKAPKLWEDMDAYMLNLSSHVQLQTSTKYLDLTITNHSICFFQPGSFCRQRK